MKNNQDTTKNEFAKIAVELLKTALWFKRDTDDVRIIKTENLVLWNSNHIDFTLLNNGGY